MFREDFAGTLLRPDWHKAVRPTDDPNTLTVTASTVALMSGINAGQTRYISLGLGSQRNSMVLDFLMNISVRTANQAWFVGFFNTENPFLATSFVRWRFDGANAATDAYCEVQNGLGSDEGLAVSEAVTGTGADAAYRIDWNNTRVEFSEGGTVFPPSTLIATRTLHLPSPNGTIWLTLGCTNANPGPAGSTTMAADVFEFTDSI